MFRALTSGDLRGLSTAFFVLFHSIFIFYVLFVFIFIIFSFPLPYEEKSPDEWRGQQGEAGRAPPCAQPSWNQWLKCWSVKELSRENSEKIPLFLSHLHNQNVMGTRIMGKIQLKFIDGKVQIVVVWSSGGGPRGAPRKTSFLLLSWYLILFPYFEFHFAIYFWPAHYTNSEEGKQPK